MNQAMRSRTFALAALLLMGLAGWFWRPQSDDLWLAALLTLLAGLCLGAALWRQDSLPDPLSSSTQQPSPPPRRLPLMAGVLILLLLAEINGVILQRIIGGPAFDLAHRLTVSSHLQMLMLIAGVSLLAWGGAGWHWRNLPTALLYLWRNHRPEILILLAITLIGFGLRLLNLGTEVRTFIDEVHVIDSINKLNRNPATFILTPFDQLAAFTWVYSYFQALITNTLGTDLATTRLQSVIWGTLTIPAVYLLARRLFGRNPALLAAALLASLPPHLHFSRLGMLLIVSPVIGSLALTCLVHAIATQSRRYYILAGILTGLLFYFGEGGKLLFPLLMLCWCIWLVLFERTRPTLRGIGWLLLLAGIVALPALYTLIGYRAPFLPRVVHNNPAELSILGAVIAGDGMSNFFKLVDQRLLPPFLHFIHLPDLSEFYYAGETGLIMPLLVPLFLLGLWHTIWRPATIGGLLLIWFLGTAGGNSLLAYNAWSARYMVAAPLMAILLAAGVYYTLNLLIPPGRWRGRLLFFLAILLMSGQAVFYFGVHLPLYRQQVPEWTAYDDVAFRALDLPPETEIYLIYGDEVFLPHFEILFEFWDADVHFYPVATADVTLRLLAQLPPDYDYAFFIDPRDHRTPAMIRTLWQTLPQRSPYNIAPHKQYILYHATADNRADYPVLNEFNQ